MGDQRKLKCKEGQEEGEQPGRYEVEQRIVEVGTGKSGLTKGNGRHVQAKYALISLERRSSRQCRSVNIS